MVSENKINYTTVTETPDTKASQEQLNRLYTRYKYASKFCMGKDVLEVACGAGQGLGYLAKIAQMVVGGDIDENNLKYAREHYRDRDNIKIEVLDAEQLPFNDNSFDVVILYEAIYYLENPNKFINESMRVLREHGVVIICTVNKDWSGFNPSPFSYKYFSSNELFVLLKQNSFKDIMLYGDCPVEAETITDKLVSIIKKTAVALNLIPNTMKGKELLKRIFMGKLTAIPFEIYDDMAKYTPLMQISNKYPNTEYKVIFAVGYK